LFLPRRAVRPCRQHHRAHGSHNECHGIRRDDECDGYRPLARGGPEPDGNINRPSECDGDIFCDGDIYGDRDVYGDIYGNGDVYGDIYGDGDIFQFGRRSTYGVHGARDDQ
jgi:hypothetical protein